MILFLSITLKLYKITQINGLKQSSDHGLQNYLRTLRTKRIEQMAL